MRLMHLASARGRHRDTGFGVLVNLVAQTPYGDIQQFSRASAITFAASKRAQDVSTHDLSQSRTNFHICHLRHLINAYPPTRLLHRVMVNHWLTPENPGEHGTPAKSVSTD